MSKKKSKKKVASKRSARSQVQSKTNKKSASRRKSKKKSQTQGSKVSKSNQQTSKKQASKKDKAQDQKSADGLINLGFLKSIQTQVTSQLQGIAESSIEKIPGLGLLYSMFGDAFLKEMYTSMNDPRRLEAMADFGRLIQEARELAGLSAQELAQSVGLTEEQIDGVEKGTLSVSIETIFRIISLVARHDQVPFLLKYLRTFNPRVESMMAKWGLDAFPIQLERERRFVNLYRKQDKLRELSDEEYLRLLGYIEGAIEFIMQVMEGEKQQVREELKNGDTE